MKTLGYLMKENRKFNEEIMIFNAKIENLIR